MLRLAPLLILLCISLLLLSPLLVHGQGQPGGNGGGNNGGQGDNHTPGGGGNTNPDLIPPSLSSSTLSSPFDRLSNATARVNCTGSGGPSGGLGQFNNTAPLGGGEQRGGGGGQEVGGPEGRGSHGNFSHGNFSSAGQAPRVPSSTGV